MQKAVVLNVYQRKIINKNVKNKLKKQVIFSIVCFCFLVSQTMCAKVFLDEKANGLITSASKLFNPLIELYSEDEEGYFVNNANAFVASQELTFMFPVRTGEVEVLDGEVLFKVNESIMVYAPEGGIVTECGISNFNTKYIKIMHNEHVFSIIDNVDVIGCNEGDIVKKGREIATAVQNNVIKLKIFNNEENIKNLSIEKNNIIWN